MMNKESKWKAKATYKHPDVEAILTRALGFDRRKAIEDQKCVFCGDDVEMDSFEDDTSLREFHISGICQKCQNKTFKQ